MQSQSSQKWLIYSLGGGLGHFHRALCISRAASTIGHKVKIISNSRFSNYIPWEKEFQGDSVEVVVIPHTNDRATTIGCIRSQLVNNDYDRLIVDTFPRGLAGELPDLLGDIKVPKILVSRFLNPVYVEKFNLPNELYKYDLVIAIEQLSPFANTSCSKITAPWLLLDHTDLYSKHRARSCFGLNSKDDRPLMVICGSGTEDELRFFYELAIECKEQLKDWNVLLNSPMPASGQKNLWPLLRYMPGVDVLVGAGGYNLVHEARQTNTRFFAFPQKRLYDNQRTRLNPNECCETPQELFAKINSIQKTSPKRDVYENGVHLAASLIGNLK